MKKFTVKFTREFEVEIEAIDAKIAEMLAKQVMAQFPEGTCKMLSVIPVVETPVDGEEFIAGP
jgi:hypothetical protein